MKQNVSPAVVAVVIIVILAVVGFMLYKGTTGGGTKATGEAGNPGPFAPGGAANNQGGRPAGGGPGGPPSMARPGGPPGPGGGAGAPGAQGAGQPR